MEVCVVSRLKVLLSVLIFRTRVCQVMNLISKLFLFPILVPVSHLSVKLYSSSYAMTTVPTESDKLYMFMEQSFVTGSNYQLVSSCLWAREGVGASIRNQKNTQYTGTRMECFFFTKYHNKCLVPRNILSHFKTNSTLRLCI